MSRIASEGKVKVYHCPTIANLAAPTVAEVITAGTNLTPFLTKDGVSTPNSQNMVDTAGINTVFDTQAVGSWGGAPLVLTMFRDDTDESDSYELITYGLKGYIVIARFGTIVATDVVEVWPVEAHQPTLMATAANEAQKFTASFAVTAAPDLDAVLTA